MESNFNSPFKSNKFSNNGEKNLNKSDQFDIRNSLFSINSYKNDNNSSIYSINKLKSDLRYRSYKDKNNISYDKNISNNSNNINNVHHTKYYISYINYFFKILKPFSEDINIKQLSYNIPLIIYITFIFIKFLISRKINVVHLCLLISLPLFAHILINKIITKKYFHVVHIKNKKKFMHRNFFKIFFNGYLIFIFGFIITKIFNVLFYRNMLIIHFLNLIYSTFIAEKILVDFIVSLVSFNNKKIMREIIRKKEGKKIYFIFFIVYSLISYIIEL